MTLSRMLALAALPLTGALIGWFTNWIAVQMLFHPRQPLRILGFTIQGLVPERRAQLAERIGRTVADELLHPSALSGVLRQLDLQELIRGLIIRAWDAKAETIFAGRPMLQALLGDRHGWLRDQLATAILETTSDLPELLAERFEKGLEIAPLIEGRLAAFDLERLERVVKDVAGRELRFIELIGGWIGFVVGLVQVGVMLVLG